MLRKSKVLALILLMMTSVVLTAQTNPVNKKNWSVGSSKGKAKAYKEEEEKKTKDKIATDEDFEFENDTVALLVGKPQDNWFFGVGAGLHMFVGNEREIYARINPVTPQLDFRIGKWLTPSIAVSLDLDLGYSRGKSMGNNYVIPVSVDGVYQYNKFTFFYYDLYGEIAFDWMNIVLGYARGVRRDFHIQSTLGMGYAWQTGKTINPYKSYRVSNYELSFHIGFNNDFKLNDKTLLFVEPKLMFVKGTWDNSGTNRFGRMDYMPSLTVGVKFNLGKNAKHKFEYGSIVKHEEILKIRQQINKLEKEEAKSQKSNRTRVDSLNNVINELRYQLPIPLQIIDVIDEKGLEYATVYYKIARSDIDYSTEMSLKTMANKIKKSEPDVKFYIVSSADKATGSASSNKELSRKRCQTCYDVLVGKYGVDPGKIEMYPLGGIDHYEPDDLNRMTIIVENAEEIKWIIERLEQ